MYDLFLRIPEEKRERIIKTAVSEFADHGYNDTNINVIAKKSGVSIGIMYKYFESKEDLFEYVFSIGARMMVEATTAIANNDNCIENHIDKLFKRIQNLSEIETQYIKIYMDISSFQAPNKAVEVALNMENRSKLLYAKMLAKAQAAGTADPSVDPKIFGFMVDSVLNSVLFAYTCMYYKKRMGVYFEDELPDIDSISSHIKSMIVNSLRVSPAIH